MEYIVVILISIISLIVLKFAFEIKIKNINKIKKIGNDKKLNDIANNLPSNQKICEEHYCLILYFQISILFILLLYAHLQYLMC